MTSRSSLATRLSPYAVGFALGFVAAVVFLPARAAGARTETVPAGTLVVVDGDTVKIGRQRLRLTAIDAPEIDHARCRTERRAGERAKARVVQLLATQSATIRYSGRDDRYRRPLIDLSVPAGDLGTILIAEGLALPYHDGHAAWSKRAAHWCGSGGR
jgi:micrococcal nuclease